MGTRTSKFKSILPKAISAVLVFWLSSILVLVCCSPHLIMASNEADSGCPVKKGHECCQKNKDAKNISKTGKKGADCCIFKPNRTLSADLQNVKISKQTPVLHEKIETRLPVFFIDRSSPAPAVYHFVPRHRGSTHLQNCVFRI